MRTAFNRICCHQCILLALHQGFPQKDSQSHDCSFCHGTGRPPAIVLPSSLLSLSPLPADPEAPLASLTISGPLPKAPPTIPSRFPQWT